MTRKTPRSILADLLRPSLFLTEPIEEVNEAEINYYVFTLINVLNSPTINAIQLSPGVSTVALPLAWNYLDGACALIIGVNQLLDEEDYRQHQMKIKGLLNILSGIQLFILSYNPPLAAALGIAGVPTVLAGSSFAFAMLVDLITATIDWYNAYTEQNVTRWLAEKNEEYLYRSNRIRALDDQDSKKDQLTAQQTELEKAILARCSVHNLPLPHVLRHCSLTPESVTAFDTLQDKTIQQELDRTAQKARDKLLIKLCSFIGMTLLAAGTFALCATVPHAIAIIGLAITVAVAALYVYRHQHALINKVSAFKDTAVSFFSPSSCSNTINYAKLTANQGFHSTRQIQIGS